LTKFITETLSLSLSLSVLMAIFQVTWVSRCLLKQRMMEVVATTGAIGCAKLQSNHHHQQTNIQFFLQVRCPSCHPTKSVKALNVIISVTVFHSRFHLHIYNNAINK